MSYKNLLVEITEGIMTISVNRPKSLNTATVEMLSEMGQAIKEAKENEAVEIVIITGSGEKAFVGGADIAEMKSLKAIPAKEYSLFGQRVYREIEELEKPVIAAVNGYALGGGCELAMACDIRIASEKAKLALPEVGLGIIPGWGGTQRLARLVGNGRAKYYIFTGEMMTAQEAFQIGLVDKVVPAEELMETVRKVARTIQSKAPISIRIVKALIDKGANMELKIGTDFEAEAFATIFSTEDYYEGLSAFLEKRKPSFKNK